MILNSWEKIFEELPQDQSQVVSLETNGLGISAPLPHHGTQNNQMSIISEFVDLSTSSEKLFQDLSLKKIKKMASDKVEKEVITFVLEKVGWNRSKAAKILKISYKTLLYKMSALEFSPPGVFVRDFKWSKL
jgi:two-component system response regulator AtoC